jgi:DNA-binding SARP family transcriptional activator
LYFASPFSLSVAEGEVRKVKFEVLGSVDIGYGWRSAPLLGRLRRTLLAVLLLRANNVVRVDVLTDALWERRMDTRATPKLHWHVHKLRHLLADRERLSFGAGGYRLRVLPGELDAERFESLGARALEAPDPVQRAELIRQALELWQGTPYQGLDVPMLADEASRLAELRLLLLEELYQAEVSRGCHASAVVDLADLVRRHPLRERARYLLMVALCRGGRQAEALEAYRAARRVSIGQLGLEPGPDLRALERSILAGEAVLGRPWLVAGPTPL